MRGLLRVFGWGAGLTLLLYGALWAVTGFWTTPGPPEILDSQSGDTNLYRTPIRDFIYALPRFCEAQRQQRNFIFVGGSTAKAYRPEIIAPYLPGWTVSDISLDFANITEVRQAIDQFRDCFGANLKGTKFALGIDYAMFAPNRRRWPTAYTVLELDMRRHGLFDGPPGAVRPILSWPQLAITITAMRPIFAAYGLFYEVRRAKDTGYWGLFGPRSISDETMRQQEYQLIDSVMGPALPESTEEQRNELEGLIAEIRHAGADLMIVDMPVAQWLREHDTRYPAYHAWIGPYAQSKGVGYIDTTSAGEATDFADGLHANSAGARRWSEMIGTKLRDLRVPVVNITGRAGEIR